MTHAELYSTSEPSAPPPARKKTRRRVISTVALATGLGLAATVIASTRPASADQIADARAQAAAITAKIQATQAQIQTLTGQVTAADYRLSQLTGQITASQNEIAKDQDTVNKDEGQLRTQAIIDYTDSGTTTRSPRCSPRTSNTSGIRSEYSSIATGNVTTTVDNLHTAQTQLQATENALETQKRQASDHPQQPQRPRTRLEPRSPGPGHVGQRERQHPAPGAQQQQAAGGGTGEGGGDRRLQRQAGAAQTGPGCGSDRRSASSSGGGGGGGGGGGVVAAVGGHSPPVPRVRPGPSRRPKASSGFPMCGAGTRRRGLRLLGPRPVGVGQAGVSLPRYLGGTVRCHDPDPVGRHRARRPAVLRTRR